MVSQDVLSYHRGYIAFLPHSYPYSIINCYIALFFSCGKRLQQSSDSCTKFQYLVRSIGELVDTKRRTDSTIQWSRRGEYVTSLTYILLAAVLILLGAVVIFIFSNVCFFPTLSTFPTHSSVSSTCHQHHNVLNVSGVILLTILNWRLLKVYICRTVL